MKKLVKIINSQLTDFSLKLVSLDELNEIFETFTPDNKINYVSVIVPKALGNKLKFEISVKSQSGSAAKLLFGRISSTDNLVLSCNDVFINLELGVSHKYFPIERISQKFNFKFVKDNLEVSTYCLISDSNLDAFKNFLQLHSYSDIEYELRGNYAHVYAAKCVSSTGTKAISF